MLLRSVKIKLILFVIITLVGVTYVSAEYVGLTNGILGDPCTMHADFPDAGGLFQDSEVTYRGVTVGKVSSIKLIKGGVRADLAISDCGSTRIPVDSTATVADRSVVGEQYVDVVPTKAKGNGAPYVGRGAFIGTRTSNHVPLPTQTLLVNLDELLRSVPLDQLRVTVDELEQAFNGRGNDLGRLLDATNSLITTAAAPQNFDNTVDLINDSTTVLDTQLALADPLKSWTHDLNLLSQQLKTSDPDIRHLLDTGPSDLSVVSKFVTDNRTELGRVLANIASVGNILVRRSPQLEEILELYPALAAGGQSVLAGGPGRLSMVLDTNTPPDCGLDLNNPTNPDRQGYGGTKVRPPNDLSATAPNVAARCTAPLPTSARGAAHVPGGDPIFVPSGVRAYPRVVTSNVTGGGSLNTKKTSSTPTAGSTSGPAVDTSLQVANAMGANSWQALLGYALH